MQEKIIQIYGSSGVGKTTLILQMIKGWILQNEPNDKKYILLIDAENTFPKLKFMRLKPILFQYPNKEIILKNINSNNIEYINYLLIYNPKSYQKQLNLINLLLENFKKSYNKNNINLINNLDAIVIDSISRLIRLEASKSKNAVQFYNNLEFMFEELIQPLLFIQSKLDCKMILNHQITTKPTGEIDPTFKELFGKIKSIWIYLDKNLKNNTYRMKVILDKSKILKKYKITQNGLLFF